MKNVFRFPLSLIVASLLVLSLGACSSDGNELEQTEQKLSTNSVDPNPYGGVSPEDLARYHNESVLLIESNDNIDIDDFETVGDLMEFMLSGMKQKHPKVLDNVKMEDLGKIMDLKTNIDDFDYHSFIANLTTKARQTPSAETKVIDFIEGHSSVHGGGKLTDDEIIAFQKDLNRNEAKQFRIFTKMYYASKDMWSDLNGDDDIPNDTNDLDCNPTSQVAFADSAGGALGAIAGFGLAGVGSVLVGYAVGGASSILVAEMQEDNGGECI